MIDHQIGTGTLASSGKAVVVHYTGWLFDSAALDHKGRKFDSSREWAAHLNAKDCWCGTWRIAS